MEFSGDWLTHFWIIIIVGWKEHKHLWPDICVHRVGTSRSWNVSENPWQHHLLFVKRQCWWNLFSLFNIKWGFSKFILGEYLSIIDWLISCGFKSKVLWSNAVKLYFPNYCLSTIRVVFITFLSLGMIDSVQLV